MNVSLKKLQFVTWFGVVLLRRYWVIVLSSFIAGLLLVLLMIRLYPALAAISFRKRTVLGLVGRYTPGTLPLPIQNLLSVGLTGITATGEAVPGLASHWDIEDGGKKYIFKLKEGISWHDGTDLTAQDISYHIKDATVEVVDPTTVVFTLKEAFSPLPLLVARPLFRSGLVGLGSFHVSSVKFLGDTISYLHLTPVQKSSSFEPLSIKFYATEEAAKTALTLGEVTMLDEIIDPTPFDTWNTVAVKKTVKYNRYVGLFFNMRDPLMRERAVRQGLAYAVDKPTENVVLTPLSSRSWAYNNRVKNYAIDIDAAQKLLAKTIAATSSTEIILSTFPAYEELASSIATGWQRLEGIEVKVRIVNQVPSDYQVLLASQEIPPDPDQYVLWHSTQEQTNITHYNSARIDKLLEDGRREIVIDKRKQIYLDFQRILVDDAPAIFLFHPSVYTITRQ